MACVYFCGLGSYTIRRKQNKASSKGVQKVNGSKIMEIVWILYCLQPTILLIHHKRPLWNF